MNTLKKIGLTAIAASLASVSAYAADLSVSGGASMSYTSNGNGGSKTEEPMSRDRVKEMMELYPDG